MKDENGNDFIEAKYLELFLSLFNVSGEFMDEENMRGYNNSLIEFREEILKLIETKQDALFQYAASKGYII